MPMAGWRKIIWRKKRARAATALGDGFFARFLSAARSALKMRSTSENKPDAPPASKATPDSPADAVPKRKPRRPWSGFALSPPQLLGAAPASAPVDLAGRNRPVAPAAETPPRENDIR